MHTKGLFSETTNDGKKKYKNIKLIITGFPEGPNELAGSMKSKLTGFFDQADATSARAQIHYKINLQGKNLYKEDLIYFLSQLGEGQSVDLVVYSLGAIALRDLPKEWWSKINSLTLVSPLCGNNVVLKLPTRLIFMLSSSSFTTDEYLNDIDKLVTTLSNSGKSVTLNLGERDEELNSAQIEEAFSNKFNNKERGNSITITTDKNRKHGLTVNNVLELFKSISSN